MSQVLSDFLADVNTAVHQGTTRQTGVGTGRKRPTPSSIVGSVWTEARIKYLRENASTLSATQMADWLGCGLTRGAVIGKLRRLGITLTKTPTTTHLTRANTPGLPVAKIMTSNAPEPPPRHTEAILQVVEAPAISPRMIQLTDLRAMDCRWPIGDPRREDFGFCGLHAEAPGKPYCAAHGLKAYARASK